MRFLSTLVASLLAIVQIAKADSPNGLADCLGKKGVPVRFMNDYGYEELAEPFNLRLQYKPLVIVLPNTNRHVQDAVICAGKFGVKVQAKSGGHSYASYSSGGKDGSMGK